MQAATWALRWVDGVPHVVLGPLALAFAGSLADLLGVPRPALVVFLLAFTAYGEAVLLGLRGRPSPPGWLLTLAIAANLTFVAALAASLALGAPTTFGQWLHAAGLAGAAAMLAILAGARG